MFEFIKNYIKKRKHKKFLDEIKNDPRTSMQQFYEIISQEKRSFNDLTLEHRLQAKMCQKFIYYVEKGTYNPIFGKLWHLDPIVAKDRECLTDSMLKSLNSQIETSQKEVNHTIDYNKKNNTKYYGV